MQTPTTNMLTEGTVLKGTYKIESHLSSGGFGNTYIATHLKLKKKMVVKEFFMKGIVSRNEDGLTVELSNLDNKKLLESQKEKFKKEAQRLATLENKNIVHVYDLFEENNTVYYTMDYIRGKSLRDVMEKRTQPLTEGEMKKVLAQLLDAIEVIHKAGILHMDIKPGNIMLTTKGYCVLIDFGASKQIAVKGFDTTSYDMRAFTNRYAPPEQINGTPDQWGPWTDFYALGATLYYCLTKKNPPSLKEIYEHENDVFSFSPDISHHTAMLIKWLMSPRTSMRPQNITAIRNFMGAANNIPRPNKVTNNSNKATSLQQNTNTNRKAQADTQKKRSSFLIPGIISSGLVVLLVIILAINNKEPSGLQEPSPAPDAIKDTTHKENDTQETYTEDLENKETDIEETELNNSETENEKNDAPVQNTNYHEKPNGHNHINDTEHLPRDIYDDNQNEPEIMETGKQENVLQNISDSKKDNDKKDDKKPVSTKPNPPQKQKEINQTSTLSPSPQPERAPNDYNSPRMQNNPEEPTPRPVSNPTQLKKERMQRELNIMNQEHTSH